MDISYLDMTHISLCYHIMKQSNVKLLFLPHVNQYTIKHVQFKFCVCWCCRFRARSV